MNNAFNHSNMVPSSDGQSMRPKTEDEIKSEAKEKLSKELAREGISQEDKKQIVEKAMKDELKRQDYAKNDKMVEKYVDKVQLGVLGWRERYYTEKFFAKTVPE
jgi:5'-3' exonuclease